MIKLGRTYYYGSESEKWVCIKPAERGQSTFLNKRGIEAMFYNHDMYEKATTETHRTLMATLPKGAMNIGVSVSGELYCDSNDSGVDWWRMCVPLPSAKGEWKIVFSRKTVDGTAIMLADEHVKQ